MTDSLAAAPSPRFTRQVLLVVELLDAVTLALLSRQLGVTAPPLRRAPLLGAGGRFIWLENGGQRPRHVVVDPRRLCYDVERRTLDKLPDKLPDNLAYATEKQLLLRILLRPTPAYAFPDGMTTVSGRLLETSLQPQAVLDAELWLEWRDDLSEWQQVRERSYTRSRNGGHFVVFLPRLSGQKPALDKQGTLSARIGCSRPASGAPPRYGRAFNLPLGRGLPQVQLYAWSELEPD